MDHAVEASVPFEGVVDDVGDRAGVGDVTGDDFDRSRNLLDRGKAVQPSRAGMS